MMRLEASGQILRIGFLGVTAASTLTSALALIGYQHIAPYVLGAGVIATLIFAYGYVEFGIHNRKNRESVDRGRNWVGPTQAIQHRTDARMMGAALAEVFDDDPRRVTEAAESAVDKTISEYRNGIDVDTAFNGSDDDQAVVGQ